MRYHWLQDKGMHEYIRIFLESEDTNITDYFTKHHPTTYHRLMRPKYAQDKVIQVVNMMTYALQGWIIPLAARAQ